MSFTVARIHRDWEEDELLFNVRKDGYGEHLYRLDLSVGADEFQAQMFLITAMKEKKYEKLFPRDKRVKSGALAYRTARLFIERDNRVPREEGGDGERWDYACHSWHMKPCYAEELLRKGRKGAVKLMASKIKFVADLPNDRDFIADCDGPKQGRVLDGYQAGCWERVKKKWAEVDRLKAEQEKA